VILASGGLTNSEIADRLSLSLRTVASHQNCIPRIGRSASARPGCQQTRWARRVGVRRAVLPGSGATGRRA